MSKEIYISSTPHETRLAIVENDELAEIYYERENEYTLAGSIYNGKVTRVLPGMQSSFVDIGLERDAFLYITDFMEEAGDSADFDSGDRSSGGGGSRGRRDGAPRRESSADGAAEPAVAGDGGERRGRRDRDNRRERPEAPRAEPARSAESAAADSAVPDGEGFTTDLNAAGAPGEEGSRRWRGRRGRRRGGRGPAAAGNATEATNGTAPDAEFARAGELNASAHDADNGSEPEEYAIAPDAFLDDEPEADDSFEGESDDEPEAAFDAQTTPAEPMDPAQYRVADARSRRELRDRSRGAAPAESFAHERGAGRDRDRGGRGGYNDAPAAAAGDTPLLLPGESLAKYTPGAAQDRPAASSAASTPAPAFTLAGAWDGSSVLPGETLARHRERPAAPAAEPAREGRRNRRVDRDPARDRFTSQPVAEPAHESASAAAPQHEDTPQHDDGSQHGSNAQHDADAKTAHDTHEQSDSQQGEHSADADRSQPADDQPADGQHADASQHADANGQQPDAEPEGPLVPPAVADFAVDFLDAAAALAEQDTEPAAAESAHTAVDAPSHETTFNEETAAHSHAAEPAEYEPGEDASASVRAENTSRAEFRQSFSADDDEPAAQPAASDEPVAEAHTFTTIEPTGEMLSQPASDQPEALVELAAAEPLPAPIDHEAAIDATTVHEAAQHAEPMHAEQAHNTTTHNVPAHGDSAEDDEPWETAGAEEDRAFAPGDGALEEELMDGDEEEDDDALLVHLHAAHGSAHGNGSAHAHDEHDGDSLESPADLGAMLRDLTLDQRTGGDEPTLGLLDDEDGFEEGDYDELELAPGTGGELEDDGADEPAEFDSAFDEDDDETGSAPAERAAAPRDAASHGEGEGRRGGRRGDRSRQDRGDRGNSDRGNTERSAGGDRGGSERSGERSSGGDRGGRSERGGHRNGGRMSRAHAQTRDLPAISELLKPGQELLVQIAKEPIAKKGARITSHIALPGRFLVFMPTVSHIGVSRKIESDGERRRLKEILLSERGEASGGFIVRTAAAGASEEELRSDLRFLLNLWADIKARSESSKSPALIYHDLNLVERVLRDQVTDQFSAIWVDNEGEYERVLRFLQRFQPALIRRVKLYTKDTPLFEQFGITEQINNALRSKVWLKSGGSIVINQTEALVAIDINTGKYVGKTARLEDTIVKTNLDAIPEIVRQIRLRDLGGIIIIDFIDMDERKNRARVMAALEEELKSDRAPSKVLQFNDFGLVAITRKRVKQSLERTLSTTCGICAGTGMVKSPITVANDIYIEMRKMQKVLDRGDVMLRVNPEVVKQLKAPGTRWLQEMEELVGKTILVKSDPSLHPEQFDIH